MMIGADASTRHYLPSWEWSSTTAQDLTGCDTLPAGGCLPIYNPDLNPIEQLFAKLKALLLRAAARTLDTPIAAIDAP